VVLPHRRWFYSQRAGEVKKGSHSLLTAKRTIAPLGMAMFVTQPSREGKVASEIDRNRRVAAASTRTGGLGRHCGTVRWALASRHASPLRPKRSEERGNWPHGPVRVAGGERKDRTAMRSTARRHSAPASAPGQPVGLPNRHARPFGKR
jgi:hypothetical protein